MAHFCGSCGAKLSDDAKFCEVCGAKVPQADNNICSKCGTQLQAGAKFCPTCGTAVGGAEQSYAQPQNTPQQAYVPPQSTPAPVYVPQSSASQANVQRQNAQSTGGGFVVPDSPSAQRAKNKSNGGCTGCGCGCLILLVMLLAGAAVFGLMYVYYINHGGQSITSMIEAQNVTVADFDYFYNDVIKTGVPEGAQTVTDKTEIKSVWKMTAYIDPNGAEPEQRYAVINIMENGETAVCPVNWKNNIYSSDANNYEVVAYSGTLYGNGVLDIKDDNGNTITISSFYKHNGKNYAVGSGKIDGKDAVVAMTK